jgi:hypothetical protein
MRRDKEINHHTLLSQYFVEAPLAAITAVTPKELSTPGLCDIYPLFFKTIIQALSNWLLIIAGQPFK